MIPIRIRLFQILLEALIPICGYFFWNWDTSFILIYYFLDWILFLAVGYFKLRKRINYNSSADEQKTGSLYLIFSGIIVSLGCFFAVLTLPHLNSSDFSWTERMLSFLSYQDMGIQQGYLILPLIVLTGVLTYKQQYIQQALYKKLTASDITKPILVQSTIITSFALVAFMLAINISYPEVVLLYLTILGTTGFKVLSVLRK